MPVLIWTPGRGKLYYKRILFFSTTKLSNMSIMSMFSGYKNERIFILLRHICCPFPFNTGLEASNQPAYKIAHPPPINLDFLTVVKAISVQIVYVIQALHHQTGGVAPQPNRETPEEICQSRQYRSRVSRFGLPAYQWWN